MPICPPYMELLTQHGGRTNLTGDQLEGIAFLYSGGAVYWKCQYLPNIALSSTAEEFASMADDAA